MAKALTRARTPAKDTRWNLRVAAEADEVVRRAASLSCRNLTEFVQQAALLEAERILADRTRFTLDEEQWEAFSRLLDRDPRENPGLAKLFSARDVFA
ncbi:MAG TPA: DUF1778 domain-containing protein [Solirubrobacteraceae bacterium]